MDSISIQEYVAMRTFLIVVTIVVIQDLQGSVVDLGRVLQHQGRHPECDDRSPQVLGRGRFVTQSHPTAPT